MQEVDVYYVNGEYPVFVTQLGISTNIIGDIKEKIINYRYENPIPNMKLTIEGRGAWRSDYQTWKKTHDFDSIFKSINDEINLIVNNFNNTDFKYFYYDAWFNMYEVGGYAIKHCHLGADLSSCYYVDVEENCSPIKFPPNLEIIPKNDMLVIFGGNLYHQVDPTKGKRMCISMNFHDRFKRPPSSIPSMYYS